MPRRPITKLVDLCEEVGVEHLQVTEVLRRIHATVLDGNDVIVQGFGTFYRRDSQARVRVLNDVTHIAPARSTVALRPPRFPSVAVRGFIGFRNDSRFEGSNSITVGDGNDFSGTATLSVDIVVQHIDGVGSRWNFELTGTIRNLTTEGGFFYTFDWDYTLTALATFGPPGGGVPQRFEFPFLDPVSGATRELISQGYQVSGQGSTESGGSSTIEFPVGRVIGSVGGPDLVVAVRAGLDTTNLPA